jgi:hypothetical protein
MEKIFMKISAERWVIIVCSMVCAQEMHSAAGLPKKPSMHHSVRKDKQEMSSDNQKPQDAAAQEVAAITNFPTDILVIVAQCLNRFEHVGPMALTLKNFWGSTLQVANLQVKRDALTAVHPDGSFSEIELPSGRRIKLSKLKKTGSYFHRMDSPAGSWWVHERIVNSSSSSAQWRVETDEVSGAVSRMNVKGEKVGDGYFFHLNRFDAKNYPRTQIQLLRNACELRPVLSEKELMEAPTMDHE